MRVLCMDGKYAIAIECVKCVGKQLIFTAPNGVHCRTDDYYHENIAYGKLSDLVVNGYIIVEKLYII